MTDDFREEFLAGANVAILGTVDAKGRPHATPVWYLYDDGAFRISMWRRYDPDSDNPAQFPHP